MAKKNYTPEEMQAKAEKKSANCKLFFGTFTKALAVFLAIVVAWSLVTIAFVAPSLGGTVVAGGAANNGGSTNTDNSGSVDAPATDDENLLGGDENTDVPAGDETPDAPAGDEEASGESTGMSNAEALKLLNDVTAKAAKGSYKWTRKSWFTKELDVGNATGTLNKVIQMVDKNATLDSVVGGFLSISGKESDPAWDGQVTNGKLPAEGKMNKDKFLFKGFTLTEADVKDMRVSGNTITIQLNACKTPLKDGKNALHHVTNDFITASEVSEGVADALGSLGNLVTINSLDVDYTSILVTAVVENNALKSVKISYSMTVNALKLKALGMGITGTGAGKMECSYTF
ncbi:MAG: hypothetical protein IJA80_06815 [Clostridia bacterium]|nr:hypothetical protein [Clostridia bacterium]